VRRVASAAERRDWDRLPISIPFFVRGRKGSGEEFLEFATALNLSAGGVLLATRKFLDPGTEISLEIPVALVNKAQLPRSVSLLHATVLRCIPDRQYYLLGLRFDEPLIQEALEQRGPLGLATPDEKIGSN
jgi:PilZ domain